MKISISEALKWGLALSKHHVFVMTVVLGMRKSTCWLCLVACELYE